MWEASAGRRLEPLFSEGHPGLIHLMTLGQVLLPSYKRPLMVLPFKPICAWSLK